MKKSINSVLGIRTQFSKMVDEEKDIDAECTSLQIYAKFLTLFDTDQLTFCSEIIRLEHGCWSLTSHDSLKNGFVFCNPKNTI